jgi:hypothetical protein
MMPVQFTLRDLPLAVRVVLAAFLISVGVGYGSALVQLHFQHASPGEFMPTPHDVVLKFHGDPDPAKRVSALKRLLEADEALPFNGSGSMSAAFTTRSGGWRTAIREKPEAEVRKERQGERDAVLLWLKNGLSQADYDADKMPLTVAWGDKPITAEFKTDDGAVKIKSLFGERCGRCHQKDGDDANAANYPLDTYPAIQKYAKVDPAPGAMSVTKLAQSTHAHLLSFAVLYMLTGVLFALTNYPGWLRLTLGPLVLVVQLIDIACWWLARLEGPIGVQFAMAIVWTGGIVGAGLAVQIVLTLFHLFGTAGRCVLVVLFMIGGAGIGAIKQYAIDPHLAAQKAPAAPAAAAEPG